MILIGITEAFLYASSEVDKYAAKETDHFLAEAIALLRFFMDQFSYKRLTADAVAASYEKWVLCYCSYYVVDIAVGVICGMVFYIEAYGVFTHHLVFA